MNQETRGRKPSIPQTIEVWYKNELEKLRYSHEQQKITTKEYERKKKELKIEKLEKEILEDL